MKEKQPWLRLTLGLENRPWEHIRDEYGSHIEYFKSRYGLRLTFEDLSPAERLWLRGDVLSPQDQLEVMRMLRPEISKYPPEFIRERCAVDGVRFLGRLKKLSTKRKEWKEVGGLADFTGNTMYLSVDKNRFGVIDPWVRTSFHHETFHFGDNTDGLTKDNQAWANLHPQGAAIYLRDRYHKVIKDDNQIVPGFHNAYGMKEEDEDQATVAQGIMAALHPEQFRDRLKSDAIFRDKVYSIRYQYYYKWCRAMNVEYWGLIENGKIGEKYWDRNLVINIGGK